MNSWNRRFWMLMLCFGMLVAFACAAEQPGQASDSASGLQTCPDSPNCVSSDAEDEQHRIAPLRFTIPPEQAWSLLAEQVNQLPRTKVVEQRADYLRAEARSAVFGFVDDLEFRLLAGEGKIAVRSAARTGYSDFGVNRRRIEKLRTAFDNTMTMGAQK